jgi:hypothetical protein
VSIGSAAAKRYLPAGIWGWNQRVRPFGRPDDRLPPAAREEAGRELGISPRTIEVHRARIMEKLGAKNAADLMRMVLRADRGH